MKIRVLEAFAGIGTQRMALRNLGIEHEVVAIAEIDKFAIASYEAIHGGVNNLGDVSKIKTEDIPNHDLFTYSFPCQDISIAGKQEGFSKNSGTRSGLLWECEKVIEVKRPKYLLMENVKNLVGKKHKHNFEKWLKRLEELGYTNYWKVLNAKDYGIPQNRERVFCLSILGEHTPYEFPKGFELKLRLEDILEDEVEEKFYLCKEQEDKLKFSTFNQEKKRIQEKEYIDTLCARDWKGPKCVRIGGIYDKEQLAPTIDTMQGGWRQPSVLIKNGTKKGYLEAEEFDGIDLAFPNSETRRGRVQKKMIQTIDTGSSKGVVVGSDRPHAAMHNYEYRIRKLTPLECWRLMGCSDEDFYKAERVNSNSQLYKQAGNAIVVDVLEYIFKNLFLEAKK